MERATRVIVLVTFGLIASGCGASGERGTADVAPTESAKPEAAPAGLDGTYRGRTDEGLAFALTLQGRTVRSATVRVKGAGVVINGVAACAIKTKLEALDAPVQEDGTFESKPKHQKLGGKIKGDRTISIEGRFTEPNTVEGTIRYRIKVRIPAVPEQVIESPELGTLVLPGAPSRIADCAGLSAAEGGGGPAGQPVTFTATRVGG